MNDKIAETTDSGSSTEIPSDSSSDINPDQSPIEQNRSLVVLGKQDRDEGWFAKMMVRIGLRSSGSLRDDLNEALSGEGEAADVFSPEERAMLQNILRLRERRVEDVMVQRAEVHAVDLSTPLGDLLQIFEDTGHSRLPVYDDSLDDPRGMVLIKDLLLHITKVSGKGARKKSDEHKTLDLTKVDLEIKLSKINVMRKVMFVPPSMLASDLMARMQATRTQMALVIDEYGGTDGLVTLEDIVEEVVGEIEDEHDEDEDALINDLGEGRWKVDARVELEKLTGIIGSTFEPGEVADDMETLGGLVFALAGHVPVRGEVVSGLAGFEFRILDADPRRVKQIQIVQTSQREKRRKAAAVSAGSKIEDKT